MTWRQMAWLVLAMAVPVAGCGRPPSPWKEGVPVRVVVTIAPLASFVKNVAGDHADVRVLCAETGPHEKKYDVQDALQFREADLFFAVGLGLDEKFADELSAKSHNAKLRYVKLGERLPEKLKLHAGHGEKEEGKEGHDHDHGEIDPHVWLGIPQAVAMVETIRDELKKADKGHAEEYDAGAKRYIESLNNLLKDGKAQLAEKKDRKIVSFHDSLAYFAKSFGIEVVAAIEGGPGDEPSAGRMTQLVELCKEKKVRVIAVEPQYPKSTSATVLRGALKAKGVEVQLVEVDPLETADPEKLKDSRWYESKMRRNVEELAKALP
jgi:ABC-type Zn uptake system ZnuABC Zn-binding protein ZnuA